MTFLDDIRKAARFEIAAGKQPPANTWFRWHPEEDEALVAMRATGFGFKRHRPRVTGSNVFRLHTPLARIEGEGLR